MSKFEMKDLSGSLFKNTDKQAETHADYKGSVKVGGQEYWLNAWLKKTAKGETFMSLSLKPKQAKTGAAPAPKVADPDDAIPF